MHAGTRSICYKLVMDPVELIRWFVCLLLLITGVSHIVRPKQWAALFGSLFDRPWGAVLIGALTLPLGLAVVLVHNRWRFDVWLIVTLLGWGWTIKAAAYLVLPGATQRFRRAAGRPRSYVLAGIMLTAIGVLLLVALLGVGLTPR